MALSGRDERVDTKREEPREAETPDRRPQAPGIERTSQTLVTSRTVANTTCTVTSIRCQRCMRGLPAVRRVTLQRGRLAYPSSLGASPAGRRPQRRNGQRESRGEQTPTRQSICTVSHAGS